MEPNCLAPMYFYKMDTKISAELMCVSLAFFPSLTEPKESYSLLCIFFLVSMSHFVKVSYKNFRKNRCLYDLK